METNDETRRRKLGALCGAKGGVRQVAGAAGVKWENLDQILKGVLLPPKADGKRNPKSLGDDTARKLELAYDLGRGWFDWPFDAVDFKAYVKLSDVDKGFVQARMQDAIVERLAAHSATVTYNSLESQPRATMRSQRKRAA
jgi:hypothetical protein